MRKILVPLDGSENSSRALTFAVAVAQDNPTIELFIVTVVLPIESAMVREFVSEERINKHYYEDAMKILAPAEQFASEAGVRFTAKTLTGTPAQKIAECVDTEHCDHVIMGTRGLGNLGNLVLGSIATKVIHLVDAPVTVVK